MKVNKVIVKATKKDRRGKVKYVPIHDQEITPPCSDKQILAALKQQYDVINFVIEEGVGTAMVRPKETTTE